MLPYIVIVTIVITGAIGRHVIHALQVDPHVQYRFHKIMSMFWIGMMCAVLFVAALHPNPADLFIIEASLYANFATEFGAMSSALAAMRDHSESQMLARNEDDLRDDIKKEVREIFAENL